MSAVMQECTTCRRLLFPARLFCPYCGGDSFSTTAAHHGTVEQTTSLADGTILATLSIDNGPKVIARLIGSDAKPGQGLPLSNSPSAGSGAYAYIPAHTIVNEDQP